MIYILNSIELILFTHKKSFKVNVFEDIITIHTTATKRKREPCFVCQNYLFIWLTCNKKKILKFFSRPKRKRRKSLLFNIINGNLEISLSFFLLSLTFVFFCFCDSYL